MEQATDVRVTRERPGVVRIEMSRPGKLNAMNASMVERLHRALGEAGADPDCRVVVLTGAGRGFCAGLDLTATESPGTRPAARSSVGWPRSGTSPPLSSASAGCLSR